MRLKPAQRRMTISFALLWQVLGTWFSQIPFEPQAPSFIHSQQCLWVWSCQPLDHGAEDAVTREEISVSFHGTQFSTEIYSEAGCCGFSLLPHSLVGCQSPVKAAQTEAGFSIIKHKSLALTRQEEQPSGICSYLQRRRRKWKCDASLWGL